MANRKKPFKIVDFSDRKFNEKEGHNEGTDEHNVHREKGNDFETDLAFLLSSQEADSDYAASSARAASADPKSLGRGERGENEAPMRNDTKKSGGKKTKKEKAEPEDSYKQLSLETQPPPTNGALSKSLFADQNSTKSCEKERNGTKRQARMQKVSRKEITGDLHGIDFSSDEETPSAPRKEGRRKATQNQKNKSGPRKDRDGEAEAQTKDKETTHSVRVHGTEGSKTSSSLRAPEVPEAPRTSDGGMDDTEEASKKKKSRQKKKKKRGEAKSNQNSVSPKIDHASSSLDGCLADIKEHKDAPETKNSPTKESTHANAEHTTHSRLSSARATKIKQLPLVPPVSTIFGLSHQQIFSSKLTDVKMKTIVNYPMSKMCKNALLFSLDESNGLFLDDEKRSQFVTLCVHVALFEANGFHSVVQEFPQILEWAPQYSPLTLEHTKTNLTVSTREAHKNSLDYTVFSFFGHIILWANELQHAAKSTTIIDKYNLGISRMSISESLGGYHLWDRLRRDKTINLKRWKHIQKFRQLFAFEEHQFVLILRCMNLDITMC